MKHFISLCLFGFILNVPQSYSAYAATVVNLDDAPQIIELETASGRQEVTIRGYQTWRTPGNATIFYKGRKLHMDSDDEYAIWKHDGIGPQRRITPKSGNLNR